MDGGFRADGDWRGGAGTSHSDDRREEQRRFAACLFPELEQWLPILDALSVPPEAAVYLAGLARRNGTQFHVELLLSGSVGEDDLYRALAAELGIPFLGRPHPDRLIVPDGAALDLLGGATGHVPVKLSRGDGGTAFVVAPDSLNLHALRDRMRYPNVFSRLTVTTPSALRAALLARVGKGLARSATWGLYEALPRMSAQIVANAWQGWMLGILMVGFCGALAWRPADAWTAINLLSTVFFFSCVALRLLASRTASPRRLAPLPPMPDAVLPTFSILVALYRERAVLPDLVRALEALRWPHGKLDVKLVCEAGDRITLDALSAMRLPGFVEVVEVPPVGPRTKPKALAYALPLARGDYVGLFDAEDQPHPDQLLEVWQAFLAGGPDLACVQAPLEITNASSCRMARMFAFEYAAHFRGLLPWLASAGLVLPLGGTSNYFRRSSLLEMGGWDPFNVTEDADLGVRLARFGYRATTVTRPTFEEAPERLADWFPQRTRWFKGWAHTWLVHMREPRRLLRDLGLKSFLVTQILFAGAILSVLAHPFVLVTALYLAIDLAAAGSGGFWRTALLTFDLANIAAGYVSFLVLGWQTLRPRERAAFWQVVLLTPVYWVLMSCAAWRAVWQLHRDPHGWEKTMHRKARRMRTVRQGLVAGTVRRVSRRSREPGSVRALSARSR